MPKLSNVHSVEDVRTLARKRLPKAVNDFIEGGAEDEITIANNRAGFRDIEFVPSILTDVSKRDLRTNLLGQDVALPIVLSPVGLAALAHPLGEVAAARAAAQAGIISTLSSATAWKIEDVAEQSAGPKWFQFYVWRDRKITQEIVDRAKASGYKALCLTVDVAVSARRERDLHNGFTIPPRPRLSQAGDLFQHFGWFWSQFKSEISGHKLGMANFTQENVGMRTRLKMLEVVNDLFDPSITWKEIDWLRTIWDGPIIIKGIMTPADARQAVELGVDAVWVSNHGGRQLDSLPASIKALPAIVQEIRGEAEIYIDGGFRRGSDIVKALAIGANACMIGRPYMYGLAANGQAGVEEVLRILAVEMDATMALLGRPTIKSLDASAVRILNS